jgi:long-chain acyl-CoA synthetase
MPGTSHGRETPAQRQPHTHTDTQETSLKQLDTSDIMIPDVFNSHGTYRRDQEAVVCGDVRRCWGDFNDNMNRVANALLQIGITKGDRVAVLMGNSIEMLEVMFGIVKSGACVVPLSGLLTGPQLAGLIEDSGANAAFATPDFIERLQPNVSQLSTLALGHRYVVHGQAQGWQGYREFVALAPTTAPRVAHMSSDDFNIIYSSGTTGLPKCTVQSHRARMHWAVSNAFEMRFSERSRALTTTSLYSKGTWLMMLPVLFSGETCVVMPAFDPGGFLRLLQQERITHTFMVPAQYIAVLQQDPADARTDALGSCCARVRRCARKPSARSLSALETS